MSQMTHVQKRMIATENKHFYGVHFITQPCEHNNRNMQKYTQCLSSIPLYLELHWTYGSDSSQCISGHASDRRPWATREYLIVSVSATCSTN